MNGILNYHEICELIESGVIEHARFDAVNPASINVTLDYIFLVESRHPTAPLGFHCNPLEFAMRHSPVFWTLEHSVILEPGMFCLASIQEKLNLPNNICCDVMLRSSAARMGIQHLLAGWGDPGYSGHLTLELKNELRYHAIHLRGGDQIVQLRFHRINPVADEKSYGAVSGKYSGDKGPQIIKPENAA